MTDRTPPQEREREARQACFVRFRDHESLRSLRAQKDDDTNDLLDAYAAAVAARVRAEMREKVEGMPEPDVPEVLRGHSEGDSYEDGFNAALDAVIAALAEEKTG